MAIRPLAHLLAPGRRPCHRFRNARASTHLTDGLEPLPTRRSMDQSLKSPPLSALDDLFHAMVARSRGASPPALAVRTSRLQRLRALLTTNEARFVEAISADFGHRA